MPYLTQQQAVRACWRRSVASVVRVALPLLKSWAASEDEKQRRSKAKRASRSKEKSDARRNAARREHRLSCRRCEHGVPPPYSSQPPPAAGPELDRQRPPPEHSHLRAHLTSRHDWLEAKKERPPLFKRRASRIRLRRVIGFSCGEAAQLAYKEKASLFGWLLKNTPGSDLLSHAVGPRSTIGGRGLNFRVRNGNGCDPSPMTTGKRRLPDGRRQPLN